MSAPIFQRGGVIYRIANAEDNEDILAAMRDNPMDGWIRLSLIQAPNGGAGKELMGRAATLIAREDNPPHALVGMYSHACLPVHLNGKVAQVGYLGALRVNPAYRHRIRTVRNGFASLRVLTTPCAVPFSFTAIASENTRARRLLEACLPGMPLYQPCGEIETLAMSTRQGKARGLLRPATPSDVPALIAFFNRQAAAYQFAPALDAEWLLQHAPAKGLLLHDFWLLERDSEIQGCLAIWDQRTFKQTLIQGYRFPLSLTRRPYNLWASLRRRPRLPAPGSNLDQVYLAFVAFADTATRISAEAISEGLAQARAKGASVAVLALSVAHPLRATLQRAFRPHCYRTSIETVSWPDDPIPVLDGRPPQPEVAIL